MRLDFMSRTREIANLKRVLLEILNFPMAISIYCFPLVQQKILPVLRALRFNFLFVFVFFQGSEQQESTANP